MPMRKVDLASAEDRAVCRGLIQTGSRSFSAASLLLPSRIREPAFALYAFCRLSDDLIDEQHGSSAAVAGLRQRLALAYDGRPADSAVDRAFADVVRRYGIPRALPETLIDGLAWDVAGVCCESLDDLYRYAACVAGSVGAMMTVLMGVRDSDAVARACDLGIAMQLTNVARDVGEDAREGRLYLPRRWLRAAGIDPDLWLARPRFNPGIGAVIERLLRAADRLYERADSGIAFLPAKCRAGIFAARHLYRGIGVEVARRGFDSVSSRARVPGPRKMRLVSQALFDAARLRRAAWSAPALPEAGYLVEAVRQSPPVALPDLLPGSLSHRIIWVAELFASLDARRQMSGERA